MSNESALRGREAGPYNRQFVRNEPHASMTTQQREYT